MTKVETAVYGSEYGSARTRVEHIVDYTLHSDTWGLLHKIKAICLGIINLWLIAPSFQATQCFVFHCVHEAIASDALVYELVACVESPPDILSKNWGFSSVW